MTESVRGWMQLLGLIVKSEFISPWGICDLVGVDFNKRKVARRSGLGQKRAITSITRAALLLRIPDIETGQAITVSELAEECVPIVSLETIAAEAERLMKDGFVVRTGTQGLQKINGWMPLQKRLVAVELKLSRVEEAISQALNNVGFADESYVALPEDLAVRVREKAGRREDFEDSGIGLLSVTPNSCNILIRPRPNPHEKDEAVQLYCVEKFWRTRARDN